MQKAKPTRKQERRQTQAAVKALADQHAFDKQLAATLLAAYRQCVATYFGSDLPKDLVNLMNTTVAELLSKGATDKVDVELGPPLKQLVEDYKAAEREPEFTGGGK